MPELHIVPESILLDHWNVNIYNVILRICFQMDENNALKQTNVIILILGLTNNSYVW